MSKHTALSRDLNAKFVINSLEENIILHAMCFQSTYSFFCMLTVNILNKHVSCYESVPEWTGLISIIIAVALGHGRGRWHGILLLFSRNLSFHGRKRG